MKLLEYDSALLLPFMRLCRDFRKHLIFEIQDRIKVVRERFSHTYYGQFTLAQTYIWMQRIAFGG